MAGVTVTLRRLTPHPPPGYHVCHIIRDDGSDFYAWSFPDQGAFCGGVTTDKIDQSRKAAVLDAWHTYRWITNEQAADANFARTNTGTFQFTGHSFYR